MAAIVLGALHDQYVFEPACAAFHHFHGILKHGQIGLHHGGACRRFYVSAMKNVGDFRQSAERRHTFAAVQ